MEFVLRSFPEQKPFVNEAWEGLFQTFVASKHVQWSCTMSSSVSGVEVFVLKIISINIPANTVYVYSLSWRSTARSLCTACLPSRILQNLCSEHQQTNFTDVIASCQPGTNVISYFCQPTVC